MYLQNGGNLTLAKASINGAPDIADESVIIVECASQSTKIWNFVRVHENKKVPDSVYTFKRKLINIQEDIQPTEFQHLQN